MKCIYSNHVTVFIILVCLNDFHYLGQTFGELKLQGHLKI